MLAEHPQTERGGGGGAGVPLTTFLPNQPISWPYESRTDSAHREIGERRKA